MGIQTLRYSRDKETSDRQRPVVALVDNDRAEELILTDSDTVTWDVSVTGEVSANAIVEASEGGAGVTDGDKGDITVTGSGATWTIDDDVVTNAKLAEVATATFKGRTTGGTGNPEDLTATQATELLNIFTSTDKGLTPLSGGGTLNFLRADGTWVQPPNAPSDGDKTDITVSGSGATWTIDNDVVTNAKLANVNTATIKGRVTASTGDPEDLTGTQATTLLDAFTSSLKGLAPASGGGTSNFLRADGTWAAPSGGSDPWTYVKVSGTDFTTTSGTAVDVTGLAFTPSINTVYEFEAILMIRSNTATVNPRVGLAWPSAGVTDGVAQIYETQAATGTGLFAAGNFNAALLVAVGGIPNTTQSWPVKITGILHQGGSVTGTLRVQLASETAGTTVTAKINSFLKYRTI